MPAGHSVGTQWGLSGDSGPWSHVGGSTMRQKDLWNQQPAGEKQSLGDPEPAYPQVT